MHLYPQPQQDVVVGKPVMGWTGRQDGHYAITGVVDSREFVDDHTVRVITEFGVEITVSSKK